MTEIVFILKVVLIAFGTVGVVRVSSLDSIEYKPFSCNFCMGFWGSFLYSLGHFIWKAVSSFNINVFPDYVLDGIYSIFGYLTPVVQLFCFTVYVAISSLACGLMGAGAVYVFFRVFPSPPKGPDVPNVVFE